MRDRSQVSRQRALRIVALLCALMPAAVALAQEGTKTEEAPHPALDSGPGDDPPPLRFDKKPNVAAPAPAPKPGAMFDPGWTYASDVIQRVYVLIGAYQTSHNDFHGFSALVRLWINPEGRVAELQFARSTGDLAFDAALRDVIRTGLTLPSPPKGLPMPLNFEISPHRPSMISGYPSAFGAARVRVFNNSH
jgi:TonB family protein